jgi:hypothetical protein
MVSLKEGLLWCIIRILSLNWDYWHWYTQSVLIKNIWYHVIFGFVSSRSPKWRKTLRCTKLFFCCVHWTVIIANIPTIVWLWQVNLFDYFSRIFDQFEFELAIELVKRVARFQFLTYIFESNHTFSFHMVIYRCNDNTYYNCDSCVDLCLIEWYKRK